MIDVCMLRSYVAALFRFGGSLRSHLDSNIESSGSGEVCIGWSF